MRLERILAAVERAVPECIGIGYVDTSMALLVAARTADSHPVEILDRVATTTSELMADPRFGALDRAFAGGDASDVHTIVSTTSSVLHVFLRGRRFPSHVLVVVCRASANLGMVLVRSRDALTQAEEAIQ